jgi:hypothetical protein
MLRTRRCVEESSTTGLFRGGMFVYEMVDLENLIL